MSNPFTVSLVSWHDGEPLLRAIRETVFIREQGVPEELEWDEFDETCRHALALSLSGEAIGCGRILPNGHIGRIAVMQPWRNQKVGTALMEALLDEARSRKYQFVDVDAQVHAVPFYQGFGFVAQGKEFLDAGLPHIKMTLELQPR
ncbi:MAG: GNAT family N-acetyltransferase [Gammaproteobacteria bacterium]|nr:GNAT family N-acetyltransferase [Gammaproteobacteria bacterium]MDD2929478.1 GNAT family N-acetyltransferase [Sideroxydans sp.]MDD5472469.1 GNAT family N-acetyltransferase [Sideroxydans sp.]